MHWSSVVTICLCVPVLNQAVNAPSKYSIPDHPSPPYNDKISSTIDNIAEAEDYPNIGSNILSEDVLSDTIDPIVKSEEVLIDITDPIVEAEDSHNSGSQDLSSVFSSETIYPIVETDNPNIGSNILSSEVLSDVIDPVVISEEVPSEKIEPILKSEEVLSAIIDPIAESEEGLSAIIDPIAESKEGLSAIIDPIVESEEVPSSIIDPTVGTKVDPASGSSYILSSDVPSSGSRILFLAPVVMYSHTLDYLGIAETLADNGHEITMVSSIKFNKPYLHREVVLPIRDINTMMPNLFQGRTSTFSLISEWIPLCIEALATQEVQNIKKEHFDLILLSVVCSECLLAVVHEMQIPFVYILPNVMNGGIAYSMAGNPLFLSFTPSLMLSITSPPEGLSFKDRLLGVAIELFAEGFVQYLYISMDRACRAQGLCSPDVPYLKDLSSNASLIIANSIRSMDPVGQPIVQNVVYAGGIHLKDAEPLPEELEDWVQSSGEAGFIYLSMGSLVKPSEMPEEYRQVFIKAFSSMDQKVLWKWDQESMDDCPDNVLLRKWLPQQDILAHPSLRLFLTHGGLHSTTEAIHSGVPVLGIPLFGDQFSNMAQVTNRGWGKAIDWDNFTADALVQAMHDVIHSQSMKKEATRLSKIMKDQIISPKDNVNYWVDYTIRHKGAYHLKCPAAFMPWYRLYNVDVWLTFAVILALTLYLNYLILRSCVRCIRPKKHKIE